MGAAAIAATAAAAGAATKIKCVTYATLKLQSRLRLGSCRRCRLLFSSISNGMRPFHSLFPLRSISSTRCHGCAFIADNVLFFVLFAHLMNGIRLGSRPSQISPTRERNGKEIKNENIFEMRRDAMQNVVGKAKRQIVCMFRERCVCECAYRLIGINSSR